MFPTLHRYAFILTAVLAVLIVVLALSPGTTAPTPFFSDKVAHFLAFTALVFPLVSLRLHHAYWLLPAVVVFGGAIELIQPLVGRQAELADFGVDVAGAVFALFPAYFIHQILRDTEAQIERNSRWPYQK